MYIVEFFKNSWIYNRSISNLMDLSLKLLSYSVTIQVNLFKHSLLAFLKNFLTRHNNKGNSTF